MNLIPTSTLKVQSFAGALYGVQVGTSTMASINADIANSSLNATLSNYFNTTFGEWTNAAIAARLVTNLGISDEGASAAVTYVVGKLNGVLPENKGEAILNILNAFSGLTSHAVYGAAATAWNDKLAIAVDYTGTDDVASGFVTSTFTLTADMETVNGGDADDVFNSLPSVGAMDYLDSYVADTLDGGAGNDTLNIFASSGGFFNASNIENINIRTMASTGTTTSIEMSNVSGVETLTVQSLGAALELLDVQELFDVVYTNNARGTGDGDLTISYDPNKVDGTTDSLNLTVDSNIEGGLVTVNGIETVNITSVGDNVVDLSAALATVNISGAGGLDLLADDVVTVNNEATSAVFLNAAAATEVNNSGADLTVQNVADAATVTNSGAGDLTYSDDLSATASDVSLVNSGAGNMTVVSTGASTTPGTLDTSITNSGEGTTTVLADNGSDTVLATVFNVSAGTLDIEDDAFATGATVTATGGTLIMTATLDGATIDASGGDATVDLTINDSSAARTTNISMTAGTGDVLVKLDAEGAIIAGDVLTGGTAADGNDVIEFSAGGTSAFTLFTGVTEFETLLYTGTASVEWTDLEALGTTIELEFGAIAADATAGSAGDAGTASQTAGINGGAGGVGGSTAAAANATILDLSGATATINVVLTENLSALGGNGGAGGVGGAGFVGINGGATSAAVAGTNGGAGGAGEAGATGGSIIDTDAVTLTLTLNGVTLDSSGGAGGAGGNGANGGAGGMGYISGTAGIDGANGGDGGNGGFGGAGGDAADTIVAEAATSVTIYSNVSDASDTNELVADGGIGGAAGLNGVGGAGGSVSAAGAIPGTGGANGLAGVGGATGTAASGLVVGDGATITVTGEGHLILGEIDQVSGATAGLTIDANDDTLGALTGDLTFEVAGILADTIIGGEGANTITLNGGADTIDLSASAEVADSITLNSATGTALDFTVTTSAYDDVEIDGFDLGLDTLTVGAAAAVDDTNVPLQATDGSTAGYAVYSYEVTDGVVSIGKASSAPEVSINTDAALEDAVNIIFTDVLTAVNEAVIWTDGTDSWLFVAGDTTAGFDDGVDYAVKLVGVVATDIADVLAALPA